MNRMLEDDDLTRLLGEAAAAYDVPAQGPAYVLEERGDAAPARPWLRRRGLQLTAAAAVVAVVAVLAQSSGGTPFLKENSTLADSGAQRTAGGADGGGTTGGTTGGAPSSFGDSGALGAAPEVPPEVAAPLPAGEGQTYTKALTTHSSAQRTTSGPADGAAARVVKTGSLSLAVEDGKVPATVSKVTAVAQSARGYVSDSTTQELGDSPSATVTLRVPVARFDAVIAQLRALPADVVSQESSGKDITASYADTEAQIGSLKAARARFLTILSGAKTIGETLTVQQRVDEVQGQIDRLEGQRRVLASQSEFATLTVSVGEKGDVEVTSREPSGLSKAWDDAVDGFTSGVEALIARSGRALLVLIVGLAGFFMIRAGWRLARRRLV